MPHDLCSPEEIFGPVTAVIPFAREDNLIRQANGMIYGLSAGDLDEGYFPGSPLRENDSGRDGMDQYLQHDPPGDAFRRI
ncbi:MAG: aldehyde dehydrogenase family protein [Nitrospira sp.]